MFRFKTVLLTGFKNIFAITTSIIRTKAATEVYAVLFSNITCWYSHTCLPYNTFNRNHVNYDKQVFRVQSFLPNLNESFSYLKMPLHLQNIIIWTKFATSGELVIIILSLWKSSIFYRKISHTKIRRTGPNVPWNTRLLWSSCHCPLLHHSRFHIESLSFRTGNARIFDYRHYQRWP